ncbi:MAG: TrmH family RNA methyltransferase [Anaerolineae bacterium]|nr:TrmH family RNA methyltransferase [Anaerolineae bacterium]
MSKLRQVRIENSGAEMITSVKNAKIKLARGLSSNRKIRRTEKAFFIEGVHAITAARKNAWDIRYLYYCPESPLSEWAQDIITKVEGDRLVPINSYVQAQLSDRDASSELMAVIEQSPAKMEDISLVDDLLVLILDRPHSPGNLGSAIRSADALGAHAVLITGHAADIYDPKAVRATMGSLFSLPVIYVPEHSELETWLSQARMALGALQVVATSAHADQTLYEHDLTWATVMVIGNETSGISRYYVDVCDVYLSIPMRGSASSVNASVAASIFLYEASRQRNLKKQSGK